MKLKTTVLSMLLLFVNVLGCKNNSFDQESFAPSNDKPVVTSISANGGGVLYCSISGGCPLQIKGEKFFPGVQVFVGPYACTNVVLSDDRTTIDCNVGAGKNGVFDVIVQNKDKTIGSLDPNNILNKFSYASFLYLGVQDNPGKVYGYAQHPTTGKLLNIVGSPFSIAGHAGTYGVIISPNNKFLYAANVSTKTVSVYAINPENGKLTAVGSPVLSGGSAPNGLYFHPSGQFLLVTNQSSHNVSVLAVASDGTLNPVAGSPFSINHTTTIATSSINGIVIDPAGQFVYVAAMQGTGGVVGFSMDQASGKLTLLPGSPFINTDGGISNTGDGITIHPNGQWLYMGLVGQKRMAAYRVNQMTGELTGLGTPILNNPNTPYVDNGGSGANISPDGLHLYGTAFSTSATDAKKVIIYAIDQQSGDLTLLGDQDAGGGPNDIRVDTNGQFAYTCNTSNSPSVSAYRRDALTGLLTPLSPRDVAIPVANSGPGIMFIQK